MKDSDVAALLNVFCQKNHEHHQSSDQIIDLQKHQCCRHTLSPAEGAVREETN